MNTYALALQGVVITQADAVTYSVVQHILSSKESFVDISFDIGVA